AGQGAGAGNGRQAGQPGARQPGNRAPKPVPESGQKANTAVRRVSSRVSRMPEPRAMTRAACLALTVACAACTTASSQAPTARGPGSGSAVITIGSFEFPESTLLASRAGAVLGGRGSRVRVLPNLGPGELVAPALMVGLVQLVPEYTGSALEFASLGRVHATASVATTASALAASMASRG